MNPKSYGHERYSYKYFLIIVGLYLVTFPLVGLSLHKPVNLGPLHLQASMLIYPLTFFFAVIIFEVYGYQVGRQLIWCQVPGTIYYQSILITLLYGLPTPPGWQHQNAYDYVFGGMHIIGFFGDFGLVIAFFVNGFIISKWKIICRGGYFWLRSIFASTIGEIIQLTIGLTGVWLENVWPLDKIISLFVYIAIYRFIMTIFLAFPANVIAYLLKKAENIDVYDINTNFNPFTLAITQQEIPNAIDEINSTSSLNTNLLHFNKFKNNEF
jgi:hypothetical protein